MNAIMSIRPNFCKLIFDGQKRYEYRKRVFNRSDVDKVYIYASKPISKVVGYFTIAAMIEDNPTEIWKITHKGSGITKEYFDAYFSGCDMAHAIVIGEVVKFDTPIDPREVIKGFIPPQNFTYTEIDLKTFT